MPSIPSLWVPPSAAAPVFDNSGLSAHAATVASGTPFTMSYTAAANASLIITVYCSTGSSGPSNGDTLALTFGGQTPTVKGFCYYNNVTTNGWQQVYALLNQSGGSGAQTISFTLTGHAFSGWIVPWSATGVTDIGPLQIAVGNTTTAQPSLAAVTALPTNLLWGSVASSNASDTYSGFTLTQRQDSGTTTGPRFRMGDTVGSATVGVTGLPTSRAWDVLALDVR